MFLLLTADAVRLWKPVDDATVYGIYRLTVGLPVILLMRSNFGNFSV